jgi:hypothetical protein
VFKAEQQQGGDHQCQNQKYRADKTDGKILKEAGLGRRAKHGE